MKGITPIISIIVLLLITVSLAGAAYVFLGGYMTGLTGKSIQVSNPGACAGGTSAVITVTNLGSLPITLGACTISGSTATCGDITVIRQDTGTIDAAATFSAATIDPYQPGSLSSATFTDPGCHTLGNPADVCRYAFSVAGQSAISESQVTCSG
jgi:flagellin-like protein